MGPLLLVGGTQLVGPSCNAPVEGKASFRTQDGADNLPSNPQDTLLSGGACIL